jgi:hypothetical protein
MVLQLPFFFPMGDLQPCDGIAADPEKNVAP